jgi:hypothetical protein
MPAFTQAKSTGTLYSPLFSSRPILLPCGASPSSAWASRLLAASTSAKLMLCSPKTMAVRGPCCAAPRRISSR